MGIKWTGWIQVLDNTRLNDHGAVGFAARAMPAAPYGIIVAETASPVFTPRLLLRRTAGFSLPHQRVLPVNVHRPLSLGYRDVVFQHGQTVPAAQAFDHQDVH